MAAMAATSHASSLDEQIERLNADITRHTASVHALEQKLLHPVNTRVAVFLSLANRQALELDSVELFVNEQPVTAHLYTENDNRFVRREIVHDFRKQPGTLRLQMTLNAKAPDYEPEVSFVEWK